MWCERICPMHDLFCILLLIVVSMQAADFFDDRRGLLEATEEIAARLFLPEPAVTQLIGQTSVSIPHQQERNALSQVRQHHTFATHIPL